MFFLLSCWLACSSPPPPQTTATPVPSTPAPAGTPQTPPAPAAPAQAPTPPEVLQAPPDPALPPQPAAPVAEVPVGPSGPVPAPPRPGKGTVWSPSAAATARGYVTTVIDPRSTDARIRATTGKHLVGVPAGKAWEGQLVVFLPGTSHGPDAYLQFLEVSVRQGLHTIGLAYPNKTSVWKHCQGEPIACWPALREEVTRGVDRSPKEAIGPADSIEGRLQALLTRLATEVPEQGWPLFLTDAGQIRWDRLVLAGHSQGGAHAAFLAKTHAVAGVLLFSSPQDADRSTFPPQIAPWLAAPWATPKRRVYAIAHAAEPGLVMQQMAWEAMGLNAFGPARSIDADAPPYGGAHILTTTLVGTTLPDPHAAVIADGAVGRTKEGTTPLHAAWRWMLGVGAR